MVAVLVTGGAGYIGSHACKALARAGYTPVTFDNLSRGHRSAVKWGPFEEGELLDQQRLDEVMAKHNPAAVMHFAAFAYVGESISHTEMYFRNNVEGSRALLDAMKAAEVKRIVFSSTCAVYGTPENLPIGESTPTNPINPYGETKLSVERMLRERENTDAVSWVALRYFNAAGADPEGDIGENHDPETHLIPTVLSAAKGQTKLVINGKDYPTEDGTCVRDYIHVNDLASAHLAALDFLDSRNESHALNLGTGEGYSILQVIRAAERVTGQSIAFKIGDPRPGDPPILVADSSSAKQILRWRPQRSELQTMIADAWQWIQRE